MRKRQAERMPARPNAGAAVRTHAIELRGEHVIYRLRRSSRRRSVGLQVDAAGLCVAAPQHLALADIEALLRQHGAWVLEKLARWRAQPSPAPLTDGAELPWLGAPLRLRVAPELRRSRWQAGELWLAVPPGGELAPVLRRVLQQRVRPVLAARLGIYAARLGVATPPWCLSSARSRWGSCNSRGEVRLSWRLGHFALDLIDYVVAHELAHLREMNHSPRFWSVVEGLYPDWRRARAELKRQAAGLPLL